MIAYLDASVLLRIVFDQPDALPQRKDIERGLSSALAPVECLRTLDRARLARRLDDAALAVRRSDLLRLLGQLEIVDLSREVLTGASEPLPTSLGTLDAIHLATALLWREQNRADLVMATHDVALARAARAMGLPVIGV